MGSAIADSIEPFFTPNIQLVTWRKRDLLIINVPHSIGPYYLKSKGEVNSTFIRLGSTNRLADGMMIENIKRLKQHLYYDELPCTEAVKEDLAKNLLSTGSKKFSTQTAKSLELLVKHQDSFFPSLGGMLLFGNIEKKQELYPHIVIRCARFHGKTKTKINDPLDIYLQLPLAVDAVLDYVKKHSINSYEIKGSRGKETPLYPPTAVREAVVNSLVHADYSVKGASIQVALFDDRLEITNPGSLPLGLSLKSALTGVSQLRNKIIGRIFRELNLIEQWGSGLNRIIDLCHDQGLSSPKFEEVDNFFRVTLYNTSISPQKLEEWEQKIVAHLKKHSDISAKQAQKLWNITPRTTSTRLKKMCSRGLLSEISTGPYDPHKSFVIPGNQPRNT